MSKTQQSVIKDFMKSLDTTNLYGEVALDAAVKSATNSKFTTIQSVIDKMVSDCKNASSADDFLENYCGIYLDNSDTGAITGSDAGGSKTKTAESVVPESGSLKNFTGNSFTANGLKFQLIDGSYYDDNYYYDNCIKPINYSDLNSNQKFMWQSLYTWWGKESLNLISNSYGDNFGFTSSSSATTKTIYFGFYTEYSGTGAYTAWSYKDSDYKKATDLVMNINEYNFKDVDTYGNPNGKTSSYYYSDHYLDRTIAHEFTHAVMTANINYFLYLPQFIKEGMAELTHGADDVRYNDIKDLAGDYSGLENALQVDDTGTGTADCYSAGYMFLRYLAKNGAADDSQPTPKFTQGDDYYINTKSNVTLKALGGKDTVENDNASNVKIYGGSGNDSLVSVASCKKVTISGDAGNDYIQIYANVKNSQVLGGTGNDIIKVNFGTQNKNKIYGGAGNDTIDGGGDRNTLSGGAGNDYVEIYQNDTNTKVYGGDGKDKIYDGGSKTTISGGNGNDYVYLYTDATNTKVNGGAGKDSIYSGATKSSLNGGSGNDYIHLYSEATSPTVYGGTGNDTIKNYTSSATTYVYKKGDGKDVISGFNFGMDKIKLTSGSVKSAKLSGNDVILTIGSGNIRIKNGKGQIITVVNSSGKTKKYSVGSASSSVSKLWFDDSNAHCLEQNSYNSTSINSITSSTSSSAVTFDDDYSNPLQKKPDVTITPSGRYIQKYEI